MRLSDILATFFLEQKFKNIYPSDQSFDPQRECDDGRASRYIPPTFTPVFSVLGSNYLNKLNVTSTHPCSIGDIEFLSAAECACVCER